LLFTCSCKNTNFLKRNLSKAELEAKFIEKANKIINVKCFYIKNKNVYSLHNLQSKDSDRVVTDLKDDDTAQINFNFCQDTYFSCPQNLNDNTEQSNSTMIYKKGTDICYKLSGSIEGYDNNKNVWEEFEELNQETQIKSTGLILTLAHGDVCAKDTSKYYQIKYKITCDWNVDEDNSEFDFSNFSINNCENTINIKSRDACTLNSFYRLQRLMEDHTVMIGIIVIAIGLFYVFLGVKLIKPTIIITFGIALSLLVVIITFNIFKIEKETTVWIIILIPFIIGMILGAFALKYVKLYFIIQGGCLGYAVGIFAYDLVIKFIKWKPEILYWIVIIACIIIFALLTLWFIKVFLIISTSIIGGFFIIKASSIWIGHFPDEFQIIDLIKNKEWDQLSEISTWHTYLYLSCWVIISVIGMISQFRLNSNRDDSFFRNIGKSNKDDKYRKV
jgi:hypothetical protein